jgi:hypothetical protein
MASRRKKVPWGEGYLDEIWEWAAQLGKDTGLAVQICLVPTRRLGCWRVVARVLDVVDGRPIGVRVQHSVDWPTAGYESLPAVMLQAISYLSLRVEEDALVRAQRAP